MQTNTSYLSFKSWFKLTGQILLVVFFTHLLRHIIELAVQFVIEKKIDLSLFLDDLLFRSEDLAIIIDGVKQLPKGQQFYFPQPEISDIFKYLGAQLLLAWQLNIVMKWAQFKLKGKNSGVNGVFTPLIDLGMIRLFLIMALPTALTWFFNPLLVMHPYAYPYSLYHYFSSTDNPAGVLMIAILVLVVVNSPVIARMTGLPGLIVQKKLRVIDAIANSFKIVSTKNGLVATIAGLVMWALWLYIQAPGSILQFPVADSPVIQYIIQGLNLFVGCALYALMASGFVLMFYANEYKLEKYH